MRDVMQAVTGNKMLDLKRELHDLRQLLAKADDPDKIKVLKKRFRKRKRIIIFWRIERECSNGMEISVGLGAAVYGLCPDVLCI